MDVRLPELRYAFFCEFVRPEADGKTTAIGLWGDRCVVQSAAPALLPALGLHAFIANPDGIQCVIEIKLTLPDMEPIIHEVDLQVVPGKTGTNVNFNLFGLPLNQPGEVVAEITIKSDPPSIRRVVLDVSFQPPGIASPAM